MQKTRVIIVDDEPSISGLIKNRLLKYAPNLDITVLDSAGSCLEHLSEHSADCILTDYQMPGMDGMELIAELRSRGDDTPVIFITGQGSEEVAREAFKNGAYDYFTKEIGFAHFPRILNSIRQAVRHQRAEKAREKSERELFEEKAKLQSVLESVAYGISIQDRDLRVLYQNPAHIRLIGEHTGEYCYRAYNNRDTECEGCPVTAAFRDGQTHTAQRSSIQEDGGELHVEISASPLRDADGNIVAGIEAVRDITARKKMEDALRESEGFLSSVFNSIRDGINIIDTEFNIIKANPILEKWLAHATPLAGKKCYEAFHCSSEPYEKCPSTQTMKSGKPASEVVPYSGQDGRVIGWLNVSTYPLIDESTGEIKGVVEYSRPVLSTDEEYPMSRRTLESIIESISFGMIIVGCDRRVRYANRAALAMMGLKGADEIVGQVCHNNICPAQEGKCPILDLGQQVDLSEKLLLTSGGDSVPILKTVTPISIEGEDLLLETFVDITALRKARDEVTRTKAFLKSVIDGIGDPIMVIDADHTVSLMNDAARRLSPYPQGTLEGMTCHEVSHGSKQRCTAEEGHGCPLDQVKKTGRPVTAVHRHMGPNNRDVWVEITASPLTDEEGNIVSVIESQRDITERKELERQRADLYAMMTHDLRGSLTMMLGYSEILASDKSGKLDDESKDMIGAINRGSKRLAAIVDGFLTISKLESVNNPLKLAPTDIGAMLKDAEHEYSLPAAQKGLSISANIEQGLPHPGLDAVYVRRALSNLVENAINYTPEGGSITLGACRETCGGKGCVVIYVTDTGPGIAEGERDKVFGKYYRSAGSSGVKGSGLGLAIVRAVTEAHGGRVELDCPESGGSTFRLVFDVES